jgi:hypothetical protein
MDRINLMEKKIELEKGNFASVEPHGERLEVQPASEVL